MVNLSLLNTQNVNYDFREVALDTWKVLVPFYHEDGDMYEIFLQQSPNNAEKVRLTDFGLTLMRLSYTFDVDTPTRQDILKSIVTQNRCAIDDGLIYVDVMPIQFYAAVNTFAQVISKVMNMDIMSRELAKSYFYELLQDFVQEKLERFNVKKDVTPIDGNYDYLVDYEIPYKRPIYLFGVKDDKKALQVSISCLNFNNLALPYRSLVVYENIDALTKYSRRQVLNATDKQFYNLEDFKSGGASYLDRELA